jgi:glycerol-3-phosphate dehydrogenase
MSRPQFSSALTPARRQQTRCRLEDQLVDVLVIGGGVVGAGAALDAASRGLSVAVIEAQDWASGTSSRSSRLVHGGIRYLEQLDFALVREALGERGRLLHTLAPHLVKPVQFLYPLQKRVVERAYVGAGMALYDILSGRRRGVPSHRNLSAHDLHDEMPGLAAGRFVGGLSYFDAQVDDARLVLSLVRTAAECGALAMNRASVINVENPNHAHDGIAVTIRDEELGDTFVTRARHVINATGVWTKESEGVIGAESGLTVTMSKGVHFLVRRDRIPFDLGLLLRTEKSVLFVIPWGQHWIVGTTDTPWNHDKVQPAATSADIDYLLTRINDVLATPLTRDDIVGVYCGLRPLISGSSSSTTKLSREHVIGVPRPGVAVIAGGKLTTYRVMAEDVVTAVLESTGTRTFPSATADIPLIGAEGYRFATAETRDALAARGFSTAPVARLVDRYGSLAPDVVELIDDDPALAEILPGTKDVLLAEIAYAVSAEDARHLEDVLVRRTRLAMELPDSGLSAVEVIAETMGRILGWTADETADEVQKYQTLIELEARARQLPDDASADTVLRRAPRATDNSIRTTAVTRG